MATWTCSFLTTADHQFCYATKAAAAIIGLACNWSPRRAIRQQWGRSSGGRRAVTNTAVSRSLAEVTSRHTIRVKFLALDRAVRSRALKFAGQAAKWTSFRTCRSILTSKSSRAKEQKERPTVGSRSEEHAASSAAGYWSI